MPSQSTSAHRRSVPDPQRRLLRLRSGWPGVLALGALAISGCGWWSNHVTHGEASATSVPTSVTVATVASPTQRPGLTKASLTPRPSSPSAMSSVAPLLADFGRQHPSRDARQVANWAFDTWDNEGKAVVIVDKKAAKVYVFDPRGKLLSATPALLGAAVGDDPVPGIGDKPLSQVLPEEKTTPAGRYVAEPGVNANGEDIVWVSWDLAVSMHRVRPLVKAERRLERLASPTSKDNRISFGCINLPPAFYEKVLSPTVKRDGAIIYVLPETRTAHAQFGSYDVTRKTTQVAKKRERPQVASLARTSVK
jgi:hypothetical protein